MNDLLKFKLAVLEEKTSKDMSALRLLLEEPGGNYTLSDLDFLAAWRTYVEARNAAARHLRLLTREMCYANRQLSEAEQAEMDGLPAKIAKALAKIHPGVVVHDDGDIRAHTIYFTLPSGRGNTFPTGWIVME